MLLITENKLMTSKYNQERRDKRAKQTAEVFTPPKLVKQMLDKLPKEVWKKGKTFCDPACGNGNFLISVLWRKLERGHNPLEALKTVFGVDIMEDNVRECRLRLLKIIDAYEEITEDHVRAVLSNIKKINISKYPGGTLDYDFDLTASGLNSKDVDRWMKWVENGKMEEVSLTVRDTDCPTKEGSMMIDFGDQDGD